jgi:predicted small secreted protein
MKKIILLTLITLVTVIAFTSCGASRRGTGCPMTEGIIH